MIYRSKRSERGMTLTEVLVAAAVIVIVISILGGAVASETKVGKKASYKSEANAYAVAVAQILASRRLTGGEEGFIVAGENGISLVPATSPTVPEPSGASGLRYTASTSVISGQNAVRCVVGIYNADGLQTQAVSTYKLP